jgi:glycosyltransferase involved in cell wall biosynthesis
MPPRVLIVIPAYNEEKTIAQVLTDLRRVVPDFDRVVVNDGSHDTTGKIISALGEKQLRLPCNLGYGLAVQTGLKYALLCGYEVVVTLDADGQHRPEDVSGLVEALTRTGADLAIGSRFCRGAYTSSVDRRFAQLAFSRLTGWLTGRRIYDTTSGFKALRATACAAIISATFMDFHTETIVRLSLMGFQVIEVPVDVRARSFGRSMHSLGSVVRYPVQTLLLTIVAAMDAFLARRPR